MTMLNPDDVRRSFDDKVRRGIFKPVARHLPAAESIDRLAEGIGLTWLAFSRYAETHGELMDDALCVAVCRRRATDPNRHLARAGGRRKGDVYDTRNFLSGAVEVLRFSDRADAQTYQRPYFDLGAIVDNDMPRGLDENVLAGFGMAKATSNDPRKKLESAVDLCAWLAEMSAEERRMLELRAAGFTLAEIAVRLGLSISSVFSGCQRLGHELAQRAAITVEAVPASARYASPRHTATDADRRGAPCAA